MVLPKMTVAQKREFLVEMCNCREYLKTDVELNKAVLKKHLKFLPQQKLYKFRACIEREFRMLEENCIWMSLASSFPDPFDHTINIDLVKNRREVKEWLGKNGSSLCFEVVKRLFEEKGLAIPYTFSDFEDYMKTCLDENGIPIKDRERAFLAAHATPDELSQMDSIIQQLVCARKRFASIEEQMTMEPEAASVGLTEEQCKAQGIAYKVGKFPMSANGKALILNGGEGLVKIIAGAEYGEILGMHIIGPRATDLIAEGALAIGGEMTLDELIDTIHSHPTVTETMREAALNAEKRAIHTKN